VEIGFDHDGMAMDFALERTRKGIRFSVSPSLPLKQLTWSRWRYRGFIYWFSQSPEDARRITVNGSDGDATSSATFSSSSRPDRHVLLVDPHYYRYRGYGWAREVSSTAPAWTERSTEIAWRGRPNGQGRFSLHPDDQDDLTVLDRYRLVMKLKNVPGCDVKLTRPMGYDKWEKDKIRLGYLGEGIQQSTWATKKYAIDIDGMTNAWSNFLVRLHLGCCVLKVQSQYGYKQWYYDRIRPFEHYVPVKPDMSDLLEKIEWVRSHDAEAKAIAENGQAFARTLDFEAGRREAVEIISANWDR